MTLPLIRLEPFFPGQLGVHGSDTPRGLRYASEGNVYWVNNAHPDSSDAHDGTDPEHPLATITQAIANCTANDEDYIIVQNFTNASETWPIALSKSKVHLLCAHHENMWGGRIVTPPADTAAFLITGDRVEVAGFDISAGATHACFEFSTTVQSWGAHIHHNRMGWMGLCQDGIRMTGAVDKVNFLIHDNCFNDKITRDGIRIEQNATRGQIWNNIFRVTDATGVCINLVTLCTDIYAIYNNVFRCDGAAQGDAITCNVNSIGCMFWGNQAFHLAANPAQNPYLDLGTNHWGLNYSGDVVIYPV